MTTELRRSLELIQGRDRLLEATATATTVLLTDSLDMAVNTALRIIGECLETDRMTVIDHFDDPAQPLPCWKVLYEWDSSDVVSQVRHPQLAQGTYEGIEDWYEQCRRGEGISCLVEEIPEPFRSVQAALGVKALHAVPIFVEGQLWGVVGFDDCREAKRRDLAELAILKTAAACLGSAIERERTQTAILQAEQNRVAELEAQNQQLENRDRLLEATAIAATVLLTDNLETAVNKALRIIGECLDTDRMAVIDHFDDPAHALPCWRILYEWDFSDTVSQVLDSQLAGGTYEGIEAWYEQFNRGEGISYLIEEMPEPFRSGQAALGVKAIHMIPIFVESQLWGMVGFDDCREAKQRSSAELAILKTAAACLGSAIERDRTQKAMLQAEQNRVAQFAKANLTLKKTLDVLATEPKLDRALGHVLQVTSEQLGSTSSALWLYDPETDRFSLHLVYLNGEIIAALPETLDRLAGQWVWNGDLSRDLALKQHIHDRAPVLYDMNTLTRGQRRMLDRLGIKAMLGIPLLLGSEIVGSFTI